MDQLNIYTEDLISSDESIEDDDDDLMNAAAIGAERVAGNSIDILPPAPLVPVPSASSVFNSNDGAVKYTDSAEPVPSAIKTPVRSSSIENGRIMNRRDDAASTSHEFKLNKRASTSRCLLKPQRGHDNRLTKRNFLFGIKKRYRKLTMRKKLCKMKMKRYFLKKRHVGLLSCDTKSSKNIPSSSSEQINRTQSLPSNSKSASPTAEAAASQFIAKASEPLEIVDSDAEFQTVCLDDDDEDGDETNDAEDNNFLNGFLKLPANSDNCSKFRNITQSSAVQDDVDDGEDDDDEEEDDESLQAPDMKPFIEDDIENVSDEIDLDDDDMDCDDVDDIVDEDELEFETPVKDLNVNFHKDRREQTETIVKRELLNSDYLIQKEQKQEALIEDAEKEVAFMHEERQQLISEREKPESYVIDLENELKQKENQEQSKERQQLQSAQDHDEEPFEQHVQKKESIQENVQTQHFISHQETENQQLNNSVVKRVNDSLEKCQTNDERDTGAFDAAEETSEKSHSHKQHVLQNGDLHRFSNGTFEQQPLSPLVPTQTTVIKTVQPEATLSSTNTRIVSSTPASDTVNKQSRNAHPEMNASNDSVARSLHKESDAVQPVNKIDQSSITTDLPRSYNQMDCSSPSQSRSSSPPVTSHATTNQKVAQNKRKRDSSPDSPLAQESKRLDQDIANNTRFFKLMNEIYPKRNEAMDKYVKPTCEPLSRLEENIKRTISDMQAVNEMLQVKEFEWNKLLYMKKIKEELLSRLLRKKHVFDMATDPKVFEGYTESELRKMEVFLSDDWSHTDDNRNLSTVERVIQNRLKMSREELERERENNDRLQQLLSQSYVNLDIGQEAKILSELKEAGLSSLSASTSGNVEFFERASKVNPNSPNLKHNIRISTHQQQYSDNEEPIYIGRRGPFRDVKSIIADFRQQHPDVMPRVGKRIKAHESNSVAMKSFMRTSQSQLNQSNAGVHNINFQTSPCDTTRSQNIKPSSTLEKLLSYNQPNKDSSEILSQVYNCNRNMQKDHIKMDKEDMSNEISIIPVGAKYTTGGNRTKYYNDADRKHSNFHKTSSHSIKAPTNGFRETPSEKLPEETARALASAAAAFAFSNGNVPREIVLTKDVVPTCQQCHKHEARFVCAGCGNQWYCSRNCQVSAWDKHSEDCTDSKV